MAINSPVVSTFRKINHNKINSIDCFNKLSMLPCRKDNELTFLAFRISKSNILNVCSFKRLISGKVSPRLLSNSIFLRLSVITPACLSVCLLIDLCMPFILLETNPVREPYKTMPIKKTGISNQFLLMLYHSKKHIPTNEEKSTLIKELIKRSASVFTFCKIESVVPLLLSSNS